MIKGLELRQYQIGVNRKFLHAAQLHLFHYSGIKWTSPEFQSADWLIKLFGHRWSSLSWSPLSDFNRTFVQEFVPKLLQLLKQLYCIRSIRNRAPNLSQVRLIKGLINAQRSSKMQMNKFQKHRQTSWTYFSVNSWLQLPVINNFDYSYL